MLLSSGNIISSNLLVSAQIDRIHLSKEPVAVIGQLLRISQDVLHSNATRGDLLQSFMLLDQRILKSSGVLIEDGGSFQAEVINDGGGCLA